MNDLLSGGMEGLLQKLAEAQSQLASVQERMGEQKIEAAAGGGLVKVTVNGNLELLSVRIDPKAIDPTDPGMLEDLILTAVNRGLQQARDELQQGMMGALGGGFPGL